MPGLTENIRIIVADNHKFFRDGFVSFLKKERGIAVVGEAINGRQLVNMVDELRPDIVLTDLKMQEMDGVEAIAKINEAGYTGGCIVLSSYDDEWLVVEAIEAGAKGYLVKDVSPEEIMEAIRTVYHNKKYYCTAVSTVLAGNISRPKVQTQPTPLLLLNEQEQEILRQVCQGKSSRQIAAYLFMGRKNVEFIRDKIKKKLGAKSIAELAVRAMQAGIFDSIE